MNREPRSYITAEDLLPEFEHSPELRISVNVTERFANT